MNLIYLAYRLMRRSLPPSLTYRLASRDQLPSSALAEEAGLYARLLKSLSISPANATILEIGPGTWNPFSLLLLKQNARRVILCEPFPRGFDPAKLKERFAYFWDSVGSGQAGLERAFAGNSLNPDTAAFLPGSADSLPAEDESADLVLSNCVLQFVPDMPGAFREMRRVLRPGGLILHVVDFRDHFFRYPFEMLAYSQAFWNWLCPLREGRGWHNRLRVPEYADLLAKVGFERAGCIPLERDTEGFRKIAPRLDSRFRNLPHPDLDITLGALYAFKP